MIFRKECGNLQIGVSGNQICDYGTLEFFLNLGVDFVNLLSYFIIFDYYVLKMKIMNFT